MSGNLLDFGIFEGAVLDSLFLFVLCSACGTFEY
jgi:hypothetical protein